MKEYRDEGYEIEIFFVFADEDVMEKRAKEREKETGRQTDKEKVGLVCDPAPERLLTIQAQIHDSATRAPRSVQELASREHVHRVRLIDNSSNENPPHLVYDSKGDDCFEKEGKNVDVMKWVEKEQSTH